MNTNRFLSAILLIAVISSQLFAQERVSFPARSSDIDAGAYWSVREFGEGCCTLDLNVVKYDGQAWEGATGSSTNEQDYTFGVPIYAPASGWVASCWRNFPDDPSPGVNPANNSQIFTGGNHVVIITDDNNAISLNHLKSGTIRSELCPSNAGNTIFPATMSKQGDWRVAAYINPADRPRIREGEKIGLAGNSGASSGPHLHISMQPVTNTDSNGREALGDPVPFRFRQGWGHRYEESDQTTPGGWYRLLGGQISGDPACPTYQADSPGCGFKMFHPSPYFRRGEASADDIKKVDTVFLSGNRAVTAVIGSDDHLKLTSWALSGLDQVSAEGDISAGVVKDVRIVKAADYYVVVAVRGQYDELKLIAYYVTFQGNFIKVSEQTAGDISALAMAESSNASGYFVTAVRTQFGNLKLIVWDLKFLPGGPTLARLGEIGAGAATAVAVARARNFNGVFTAARDGLGNLKVIPWKISDDGMMLTQGEEASGGQIGYDLSAAGLAQGVAVAATDSDGKLCVQTWEASPTGDITASHDTLVEGAVSEIALLTTPLSDSNFTAAVRDATGSLRLIGLLANDDGTGLRRTGASRAGAATSIAAAGVSRSYPGLSPRDMILTAMRDSGGDLKLITWDTNLVNP